jgi:hypothetical protein
MKIFKLIYQEGEATPIHCEVFTNLKDAITEVIAIWNDYITESCSAEDGQMVNTIAEDLHIDMDVAREWDEKSDWEFYHRFAAKMKGDWIDMDPDVKDNLYFDIQEDTLEIPIG